MTDSYISYSREVKDALSSGASVVVMETAGTFEGVRYPDNLRVAENLENKIRNLGAVPAFAAVIDGVIKVGLSEEEKERIANPAKPLLKASRRDLPVLIAKKETALTAVAAAMLIADRANLPVVCGGGIGGVHRDYANCLDVSADLEEFTKSNVIVVTSGAKSILDLAFTMEYLETKAVPVVGYRTNDLPAYLVKSSGLKLDHRIDSPEQVAEIYKAKNELGMPGGILVANPIPEEYSVDVDAMNEAIEYALQQAREQNVHGKIVTKFIMGIINERMGKDSAEASEQMNYNNAALAARIAVAMKKTEK